MLYPKKVGKALSTAFHFLNFKTEKHKKEWIEEKVLDNKNINSKLETGYRVLYVCEEALEGEEEREEGFFNIVDGKRHTYNYVKKIKKNKEEFKEYLEEYVNGSKKPLDSFLAGPNYITDDDGWKFEYLSVEALVNNMSI